MRSWTSALQDLGYPIRIFYDTLVVIGLWGCKEIIRGLFLKSGILGLFVGKGKKEGQFMRSAFLIGDAF